MVKRLGKNDHPGLPENSMQRGGAAPLLSLVDINKSYRNNGAKIDVLSDLSVDIFPGETIAIVGESGIGKSTLLHILGTLDRPDSGTLAYKNSDVFEFDKKKLADFRNKTMGFVFQFHYLLSEFSALENVMMPGLIKGLKSGDSNRRAQAILIRVGLKDRLNHRVSDLSGGEQQRVALARALVLNPAILLADEPTGNLDKKNSKQVHDLLFELNEEFNMTIITVTHNMQLAEYMNRQMTLVEGTLVEIE
ncbi:MAG: ABC transporter ATP-binding protein [Desulfobacteraceae bacterium]|jgi:lipoprotein-releasing system ATP-binding protein|nr:ABC transporter ATP-binding protein [Desulfobacteraceae bacterium]